MSKEESHHHHSHSDGSSHRHNHHSSVDGRRHSHHHHHHHTHSQEEEEDTPKKKKIQLGLDLRIITLMMFLLLIVLVGSRIMVLRETTDIYSLAARYYISRQAVYTYVWCILMAFFLFYYVIVDNRKTIYLNTKHIHILALLSAIGCSLKCILTATYCIQIRDFIHWYHPNNISEILAWMILAVFFTLYWRRSRRR